MSYPAYRLSVGPVTEEIQGIDGIDVAAVIFSPRCSYDWQPFSRNV